MTRFRRTRLRQSDGYIVTLTVILILSLIGIAIIVGSGWIRNALVKRYVTNMIVDSTGSLVGKPVDFGICEEPTILCPDPDTGLLAWLGVRPDRFVTRNQVFYANTDCSPPVPGTSCPDSPGTVSCLDCGNCDPVNCPENCTFTGTGVYLAPPAVPVVVAATACVTPPAGMVGWWPGDGTAEDIVGGNGGILQNGATFGPGMVQQGFLLDGDDSTPSTGDYVSVPDDPAFRQMTNITIDAWIRAEVSNDSPLASGEMDTIVRFDTVATAPDLSARVEYAMILLDGRLGFGIIGNASGDITSSLCTTCPDLRDGQLHHVAIVRDDDNNSARAYVDGVEVINVPDPADGGFDSVHTAPLKFGQHAQGAFRRLFRGIIDEVEIFSRALSGAEIASIYNAGADGKCKESSGVFPPTLPVGYLNGSLDVTGTPGTRVVYGVGSPGDWITCNPGVTPNLDRLPCDDGGELWRGGGEILLDTPIQSVWTSLAPDCAPGELGSVPVPPSEPVPILAAWDFKTTTETEAEASFIAPEASVTTTCPNGTPSCMAVRNRPVIVNSSPTPPGYAQFGPQPSSPQGGCNCANGIACLCDGPSLPAQLTGVTTAPSPTGVQLTDNTTDFSIVPVGSTTCIIDDPPVVPERCGTVSVVGTNTLTLSPAIPGGVLAGDEYRVDLLGGGGEPPFLELEVSCADLDPAITEVLSSASFQFNARKVSADGQETGRLHLYASCDDFATFTEISPTYPTGAPDCSGSPGPCIDQDFGTVYAYDLDLALATLTCPVPPGNPPSTWTIRITSERTGGSQDRFDTRLDGAIFSAFCQAAATSTEASGFTEGICINTALTLNLVAATEVLVDGGTDNVLAGKTPLYSISAPNLVPVAPRPESEGLFGTPGTLGPQDYEILVNQEPTPESEGLPDPPP